MFKSGSTGQKEIFMFTFTKVAQAVAAIGALSLAGSALAANTIYIDSFTKTGTHSTYTSNIAKTNPVTKSINGVYAGEMSGKLDTASFQTFCVDIFQDFPGWGSGNSSSDYSLVLGSIGFGAKATDVNKLFTHNYSAGMTEVQSTAFQLALWEIVYESNTTYDLSTGTFTATDGTSNAAGVYSAAGTMLGNLGDLGSLYTQVDIFQSASKQDFTTISVVPEPEAYALALVGLGVLVGARKLKGRSKSAQASA